MLSESDQRHLTSRWKRNSFGVAFGWFSCCESSKLMTEQQSKQEKSHQSVQVPLYPSIVFSLITSHWRTQVKLIRGDGRELYLLILLLLFRLFLPLCQGTCFAMTHRVGKSISIHLSTSLPTSTTAATDAQTSISNLQSARWHWPLGSAAMWLQASGRGRDTARSC